MEASGVEMPTRVAHIVGKMLGGGVEAVVMNYYRHIDRSKYQFDLLVDADSTRVPVSEVEELGGRVFDIPPYQHQVPYQRELKRLFEKEKWPIVHSHINTMSVFPLRAAKMAGVPIRIAHSHSTSGSGELAKNAVKGLLKHFAKSYATTFAACSQYAGEWLFGKETDFEILRNAIDTHLFMPSKELRREIRAELGIGEAAFVVGHIGRFVEQKNHSFLLDIFRSLRDLEPASFLVCAGDGPLFDSMVERSKKLGLNQHVVFLGQYERACELYQTFDVFCLPSLYEGLPVVGVECQASHVPLLASNAVTSETSFTSLIDFESLTSSPKSWAEHLLRMRGRQPLPKDEEGIHSFDIEACALKLQRFYDKLLGGVQ